MSNPRSGVPAGEISCKWRWLRMRTLEKLTFDWNVLRLRLESRRRLHKIAEERETRFKQSVGSHNPQVVMEEEVRPWDNLPPEILELIFGRCSLQDKFCVIPSVCKSWKRVLASPSCWQEIDILKWSTDVYNGDRLFMLHFLLMKNSGVLKTLSICCVDERKLFSLIANHAQNLETLKMPMSFLSDSVVIENASKLSNLRFLDVSYCSSIGAPALEAIGKHCKHLTGLRRTCEKIRGKYFDEEAFAIAATMPKLKTLEIPKLVYLTATPVLTILSCCTQLEFLDVIESYYVGPEKNCRFKFYWMILSRQRGDVVIRC